MNGVKRVVIRVDASTEMGMGHLMRCLSLAGVLADDGAAVLFLLRSHAAGLVQLIEGEGHAVRLLPDPANRPDEALADGNVHARWLPTSWKHDAEQTLAAVDRFGRVDWLIVDHYALDGRWERMLRERVPRILAIDDLADRNHDCDMLLDQNLVLEMDSRYDGRVPPGCRMLLGPGYALLRAEFAQKRNSLMPRNGEVGRILVGFGGSDLGNETAKALAAIKSLHCPALAVDVVIGLTNPNADSLALLCGEMPMTRLHRGAGNMAELMENVGLAIGAGGIMSWERCCLGLPTIAVDIADNQIGALKALSKAGAAIYLGSATSTTERQIANAIKLLIGDAARARAMGETSLALVDGEGASRVMAEIRLATE